MTRYIKVRLNFNGAVSLYKYNDNLPINFSNDYVVETRYGVGLGKLLANSLTVEDKNSSEVEFHVLRLATDEDFEKESSCQQKALEAFDPTKEKIIKHNLAMKLISIHFFHDNNKILFNFTADGRVDFRELVKDLASTFKTRIELRQIGVRDESMILGGFGVCGREFCCKNHKFHGDPISIKMAKEQNLTLNSVKISGVCGRLMCCLDYEFDQYSKNGGDDKSALAYGPYIQENINGQALTENSGELPLPATSKPSQSKD